MIPVSRADECRTWRECKSAAREHMVDVYEFLIMGRTLAAQANNPDAERDFDLLLEEEIGPYEELDNAILEIGDF